MPAESVKRLLEAAIDYAGLFPPASLPTSTAVEEYVACRSGPFAWMLGRMVTPVSRLEEFEHALNFCPSVEHERTPWRVSAIAGPNIEADAVTILKFNSQQGSAGRAIIDSVEIKTERPEEIYTAVRHLQSQFSVFFELPLSDAVHECMSAVQQCGAFAKVRTGGMQAEQFPSCAALVRFVQLAVRLDVPFKATAGLHHAIRGIYPVGADRGGASVVMHGFLNLLIAVTLSRAGGDEQETTRALEEQDAKAFCFGRDGVDWRGHHMSNAELTGARRNSIRSWGSCSFNQPVEDLRAIHLL